MSTTSTAPTGRRARTRQRLIDHGLELIERQGYEQTTAAQIAAAAGVTEMTFFRHFATKEQLVLEDPYDPFLASGIGEQPRELPPLRRAAAGILAVWRSLPEPEQPEIRRRVRIAARTPALRGAMWRSTGNTEAAIVAQLVDDGTDPLDARVAASAVLAALVTGLYAWADGEVETLGAAIERALAVVGADRD
ncbi:putative mycofactocin biosynthesis transcriptional regulator MftR [Agromyces sp. NDB4Y10]|uniref:TetR/AcrR family transcriptional regulator n=1 Tax=Agromyces sp. NDB4Y10 TaxID=1775951 RepID=UPI0007B19EDF|nr:TetR/AcrR family transcriptional regulator [Agromyces sp. NDB4Y10]KZE93599.1 putative mycofactocin biosynthesis transcriptional regulator MftR [Agromyces sp. NDB4Y10]